MNEGDGLTVGGSIIDHDRIGSDDTLFSAQHTFEPGRELPASYTLSDRLLKLVVRLDLVTTAP
ncbi:MAG: hypothetical protein M1482_04725 [Chloroflexi bacterium]|nr:hypothetical protein [Chloroflexota bacterium]